jgi:hypothetical protein
MAGLVNSRSLVLDPMKMLRCFDDDKFEAMVEDWQRSYIGIKYQRVERFGSANDKGRDIVCTGMSNELYIFQRKNYNKKLGLSDILPEIGKCCYHCYLGAYNIPKEYRFVSPLGVSPSVADLFSKPFELKNLLKENWARMCQTKIKSNPIPLIPALEAFIDTIDFSIFNYKSPKEFIDDFGKTCYFSQYFMIIIKSRPLPRPAPEEEAKFESIYISKLLAAYSDYLNENINDRRKLEQTNKELFDDFKKHREYFYSAESLAEFSREIYPPDEEWFEQVKEEFYQGIIREVREDAKHGFERLGKVLRRAQDLNIGSGKLLASEIKTQDRMGICHHLANERDDVRWKKG